MVDIGRVLSEMCAPYWNFRDMNLESVSIKGRKWQSNLGVEVPSNGNNGYFSTTIGMIRATSEDYPTTPRWINMPGWALARGAYFAPGKMTHFIISSKTIWLVVYLPLLKTYKSVWE